MPCGPVHQALGVFDTNRTTARQAVGRCIKKMINLCFQKDVLELLQQRLTSLKKSPLVLATFRGTLDVP
jgi:hypothetical protein